MVIMKLILTIMAFSAMAFQAPRAGGDNELKVLLEKSLPTQTGQKLRVDAYAGTVKITSWSKNEIYVKISGNSEAEDNLDFEVSPDESGVKVDALKKSAVQGIHNLTLKFEISVPLDYNVKVTTGGGNVTLTDLNGTVDISTKGGNVSLGKIDGSVDVSTAGGNISVDANTGRLKLSTAGGNINAEKFDGDVDASTAGGNIHLTGSNGKVEASTAGGNIHFDYSGKNMGVDLSTMAGQISLDLPSDFAADVDLTTMVGKIRCDFNGNSAKGTSNLKTTFNNGGEPLKCSTMAGNIKVSKKQ
jgi:DUF4097 and DUF4098 domain-containing protein YvlB